jgi:site-specific recombinase XerD
MRNTELTSVNFKSLLSEFTKWVVGKKLSKSMNINYPSGLKEFFLYLEKYHDIKHINMVEQKHTEAFKLHLQTRIHYKKGYGCLSNQTINGILKAVNSFNDYIALCSQTYKFAIKMDYLRNNTAEKIVLTQSEVQDLYNATFEAYPHSLSSVEFGQRDRVIIALLYSCGLRKYEASQLDINDVDFINKRLIVRYGKYSKQRFVPIPNQALEDIKAYIQTGRYYFTERHHQVLVCRKKSIKKLNYNPDETALLLNIGGTRMLRFQQRLTYLKSKTMITKPLTPHVLRHSYGSHMYQNGLSLEKLRIILGHSSVDTTQVYVHLAKTLKNENEEEL